MTVENYSPTGKQVAELIALAERYPGEDIDEGPDATADASEIHDWLIAAQRHAQAARMVARHFAQVMAGERLARR